MIKLRQPALIIQICAQRGIRSQAQLDVQLGRLGVRSP